MIHAKQKHNKPETSEHIKTDFERGMLILLHGKEFYLVRARLGELKEEAGAQGALIQDIDCKEADLREVFQAMNTSSLFNSKKLVVFHDPFETKEWNKKEVRDILLKADSHTLVFVAKEAKNTDPLAQLVSKHGKVEEFPKLKGAELKNWLAKELKKQEVAFALGADELLLFFCGDDAELLSREIAKLKAFKSFSAQKTITKEDVSLLVKAKTEPKIFSTIDALAKKDRKQATTLLSEHLKAGEPPLQLLSMFAWQFRLLLSLKDLQARGVLRQDIAQKLHLHPFVAQKSFAACQRFSLEELKELYKRIFALDLAFKTGKGNPEQLLYLFAGQVCSKPRL